MTASQLDYAMGGLGPQYAFGPMEIWVAIDLAAPLEREEIERAMAGTVRSFPVLGSRYQPGFWRDRWVRAPECGPRGAVVTPDPVEDLDIATRALLRAPLDLVAGWPWRIIQLCSGDHARLVVQVKHAASDAAGVLAAVAELGAWLGDPDRQPLEAPEGRGLILALRSFPPRGAPRLAFDTVVEALRPLALPLVAVAGTPGRADPSPGSPAWHELRMPLAGALRKRCERAACTINDLLVATMIELVRARSKRGLPAAFFTVDLRRYLDDHRPRVDNLSAFDTVMLPRRHTGDLEETARRVALRTRRLRSSTIGLPGMLASALASWPLPMALQRIAAPWGTRFARKLTTRGLLVTNIGVLDPYLASWGERVRRAWVLGPFLEGAHAPVFTVSTFREELSLVLDGWDGIPLEERLSLVETVRGLLEPET